MATQLSNEELKKFNDILYGNSQNINFRNVHYGNKLPAKSKNKE